MLGVGGRRGTRVGTHAHAAINPTSANHDTTAAGSNHQSGRRGDGTNAVARENWSAVQALIVRVVPTILIASSTCTSAASPAGWGRVAIRQVAALPTAASSTVGGGRQPVVAQRQRLPGGDRQRRRRCAVSPKLAISHRRAVGVT